MRKAKVIVTLLLCLMTALKVQAAANDADMADLMRSDGKIYVVVIVLAIIFAGIIVFLVRLERKITKLEKNS
jgi:preprotein translocase subunit SecY